MVGLVRRICDFFHRARPDYVHELETMVRIYQEYYALSEEWKDLVSKRHKKDIDRLLAAIAEGKKGPYPGVM